jgi:hypothetical protein
MPRKIPAAIAIRWLKALEEIKVALQAADDTRPCIEHSVWQKVWGAKCDASAMHAELLAYVCADVEVETRENVNA